MASPLKIGVIQGSLRPTGNALGMRLWLLRTLSSPLPPHITLVPLDLTTVPLGPFLDPIVPWTQPAGDSLAYASPTTREWSKAVAACDGYICLFPQHNYSFPGELKNAFDHLYWEWTTKPIVLVEYSPRDDGRGRKQLKEVLEGGIGMKVVADLGIKLPYSTLKAGSSVGDVKEEELGWLEERSEALREAAKVLVKSLNTPKTPKIE